MVNEDELSEVVGNATIQLLAPCLYKCYRRSRMKANSTSIAQLAILDACHGLGSQCYPAFCGKAFPDDFVDALAHFHQPVAPHMLRIADAPAERPDDAAGEAAAAAAAGQPIAPPAEPDEFERMAKTAAELNRQMRKALSFFARDPHWVFDALTFILIMQTYGRFVEKQFERSSLDYELQRRMAHAQYELHPDGAKPPPPYAVENSMHVLEDATFEDLRLILDYPNVWQYLIPSARRSQRLAALANRLIVGLECSLEVTIVNANKQYPTKAYRCLHSEELARGVRDDPPCLFDKFTSELVDEHKHDPLHLYGAVPRARLAFLADNEVYDVMLCENWHASMRNRSIRKGSHGRGEACEELFAALTVDRQRSRLGGFKTRILAAL